MPGKEGYHTMLQEHITYQSDKSAQTLILMYPKEETLFIRGNRANRKRIGYSRQNGYSFRMCLALRSSLPAGDRMDQSLQAMPRLSMMANMKRTTPDLVS